jgi:hypothetical protein
LLAPSPPEQRALHCVQLVCVLLPPAAPGVVPTPRINVAGKYSAVSNAAGARVGTTASGPGLSEDQQQRAGDFFFKTDYQTAAEAEQTCRDEGGHLAAYLTQTEQFATEQYYVDEGYLFPLYHKVYWLGLQSTDETWPTFTWTDLLLPGPNPADYQNWGTLA